MADDITLDLRGLEPPEPLERVLEAISALLPGQRVRMLIEREPYPLYRILDNNGYAHKTESKPDFLYEVLIWQKA